MMLDMGTLLAGTKYRGEFEARLKAILEEAADMTNNIILFIDEIHTIIGSGNQEGSADAANMLKPLLARGKIKLIGATTFDEYQKHIEKDAALKRRFQELFVDEPNTADTMAILNGIKKNFEDYHGVVIDEKAIEQAVYLSKRYILNKHLPDKAIDIIDEAAARKSTMSEKLEKNNDYKKQEEKLLGIQEKIEKAIEKQDYFQAAELKEQEEKIKAHMKTLRMKNTLPEHLRPAVTLEDIGRVLADKIGVPAHMVTESETEKLKRLEKELSGSIVGQQEAVEAVVKSIKRNRLSVVQKSKPIASFLFMGPSGVGKTYLAKLLAKQYFGDEKALIRVDMSEFMEKHSASKLIGSPAGYVGYDEGGVLTEAVRRKPYSIVLFDEIEKASPDVLNILLQLLDEGHLKDNKGRRIDFKSTIIVLTSNIGSEEFGKRIASIGFDGADEKEMSDKDFDTQKKRIMERLKDWMKPELLNRLDYTIIFRPLSKQVLGEIFVMKVNEFLAAWKHKEEIKLPKFTKKKVEEIIEKIYNPQFGARPIERYIYDEVEPGLIDQMMN
ncbi:ATP-dependent Clp protease ATP-binding subunit [Patescibacteria group bacterium]|nr:ATP-dependent Clp protease ATP-binding subunit [Patescibacteria group bacterium]